MKILNLDVEKRWWRQGYSSVAGIDEVGRGCIAGPVVAACVIFPHKHDPIPRIYDSKQLSAAKRTQLAGQIMSQATYVGVGISGVDVVDQAGIVAATCRAMHQAVNSQVDAILVDGNSSMKLESDCRQVESIVKGDSLIYSIAAASIVAKVYRDDLMINLSKDYPVYYWDKNKGYGTRDHFAAIHTHGLTIHHRKTFLSSHRR